MLLVRAHRLHQEVDLPPNAGGLCFSVGSGFTVMLQSCVLTAYSTDAPGEHLYLFSCG